MVVSDVGRESIEIGFSTGMEINQPLWEEVYVNRLAADGGGERIVELLDVINS